MNDFALNWIIILEDFSLLIIEAFEGIEDFMLKKFVKLFLTKCWEFRIIIKVPFGVNLEINFEVVVVEYCTVSLIEKVGLPVYFSGCEVVEIV